MSGTKPEAEKFDRWVCHEILPAIRKDGLYVAGEEKVKIGELTPANWVLFTHTVKTGGRPSTAHFLNLREIPYRMDRIQIPDRFPIDFHLRVHRTVATGSNTQTVR